MISCEFYKNGFCSECTCTACGGSGMVITSRVPLTARECSCRSLGRYRRTLQRSGLGPLAGKCTFESFREEESWQALIKKAALLYTEEGCRNGNWFMLTGQSGCGKTHLCTAVCMALAKQGRSVQYFRWVEGSAKLKALVQDRPAYEAEMKGALQCAVLYIDDFLKPRPTEADLRLAMEILGARYDSGKLCVLSSERSMQEILELDEALGGRIAERCGVYNVHLEGKEKNRRVKR